jgi:hypothetical protein
LDDIELAIEHPPAKPDHAGTAISLIGAGGLVAKTLASPIDHGWKDALVIGLSIFLSGALLFRWARACIAKTPSKDLAKKHILRLKLAQGWKPPPPSNWKRLRMLLWQKMFDWLSRRSAGTSPPGGVPR